VAKRKFIAIAGNIGAGKTELTAFLCKKYGLTPFFEPNDQNPYLADFYKDMNEKDRRERQEFIYEATIRMRDRLFSTQAYERCGIPKQTMVDFMTRSAVIKQFRSLMFVNVVPNIKKIGLLDGFLAEKFGEIGILQLQDFDTEGLLNKYIYGGESLEADQAKEAQAGPGNSQISPGNAD